MSILTVCQDNQSKRQQGFYSLHRELLANWSFSSLGPSGPIFSWPSLPDVLKLTGHWKGQQRSGQGNSVKQVTCNTVCAAAGERVRVSCLLLKLYRQTSDGSMCTEKNEPLRSASLDCYSGMERNSNSFPRPASGTRVRFLAPTMASFGLTVASAF